MTVRAGGSNSTGAAKKTRHLKQLDLAVYARSIVAYTPTPEIIQKLMHVAHERIADLATIDVVLGVMRHNPETISVLARGGWQPETTDKALGFVAHLPLRSEGVDALFDATLNTTDPDLRFVCKQHERPAAIYFWGILLTPATAGGIALVMERMTSSKYADLPMYCKAANEEAHQLFVSLGFKDGATHRGVHAAGIMACSTSTTAPTLPRPRYDSYRPGAQPGALGIKVVHDVDELIKVRAIRAATYIAEQDVPYAEEVDGNDLTATHLLGHVGSEPGGCIRIRYFANFVKLERLSVLRRFRRTRLAFSLVQASIDFARAKGYCRFYGQAEESVIKLWTRFGFSVREGRGLEYLTNRRYFEGDLELPANRSALSPFSGADVLLRKEGQWDVPAFGQDADAG